MKSNKFIDSDGTAYEIIASAQNIETSENSIIYRKTNGEKNLFVCSKAWWNNQGFVPMDAYIQTGITKYSSVADKIKLYMSLFIGRDDVYAKRWESKSGKCGYSPVCLNEWLPSVCIKPSGKCADCAHKNYAHFTADVIENHLRGSITAGIYPMLPDETCRFLAIDFDDGDWKKDIAAVASLCKNKSIPAYIERSRSGEGGHLWIFFSENIPAVTARKLGSCILTAAMNERHEIKFTSYDRLFPNQDTMPKGGFGNLIALPLQKFPRQNGNSVFVDENFNPYNDQWAFLSNVKSLSEHDILNFVKTLHSEETVGLYEGDIDKPWERKKIVNLSNADFPPTIIMVSAIMI